MPPGAPSRSASPSSFPARANGEGQRQERQPRDDQAPERRQHPALGQLDANLAAPLRHRERVDEIAEREQPTEPDERVDDGSHWPPGQRRGGDGGGEQNDQTDTLRMRVEER